VADDILPNTHIRFLFRDSKCDGTEGLMAALYMTRDAFHGKGCHAIIGAGCSGASVTAAQVAGGSRVPVISPSATSPVLSDGKQYPFFLRTIPSDDFGSVAMVDLCQNLWNYTTVALAHSTDVFGSGASTAFVDTASASGMLIITRQWFATSASDFSRQQSALRQSGSRVIVLICQVSDGSRFMRTAHEMGVGGPGYLWLSNLDDLMWETDSLLASDVALRDSVLTGYFSILANGKPQHLPEYQSYVARRQLLSPTLPDLPGGSCNEERDDDGEFLWARANNSHPNEPHTCTGHPQGEDGSLDSFGYDATFAILHALHDLVEVQNRSSIVGSELLTTLITRVRFQGVTGLVGFHDASSNPDRVYNGDRRIGLAYTLKNYADHLQGLQPVGSWTPCPAAECAWLARWQSNGRPFIYSTEDNSQPQQASEFVCPTGMVLMPGGMCDCDKGYESIDGRCMRCARGTFKSSTGNGTCAACSAGSFQESRGSRVCAKCSPGTYQPYTGSTECLECLPPLGSLHGSTACDTCSESYYRISAKELPSAQNCQRCHEAFQCDQPNTTLADVYVRPGWWRLSTWAQTAYRCRGGANGTCAGGRVVGVQGSGYCASSLLSTHARTLKRRKTAV